MSVDDWFMNEILPLEGALIRFLRANWRNGGDVEDFRQEVYARVYAAASRQLPDYPKALLFTTARNLLIDQVRRSKIVSIETVMDLDTLNVSRDEASMQQVITAREEIRMLEAELEKLPRRTREIFLLRKVDGLSQRETAKRLRVSEPTVERHLRKGILHLANALNRTTSRRDEAVQRTAGEMKRFEDEN
jgi:RNA polymerase sigma-70 factor (ECF subfamily)